MSDARLTNADWWQSQGLRAVVAALGGEARIVGGAVRDVLLGLPVADVDLATPLLPDEVTRRLQSADIKAVPTGIDHGTVTAVAHGQSVEITTLRRDVSTDGRRATVAFSDDWEEDAARRDFTINALYADPESGEIFDYFGGLADLDAHKVRFIGKANERIAEDHLRILRFFRFHARFGGKEADATALAACEAAAKSLMALSRERIADELLKLLALPDPSGSVGLMIKHGIFGAFLPEIQSGAVDGLKRLVQRERKADIVPSAGRRLNAILCGDREEVSSIGARLKMSNKARVDLELRLHELHPHPREARELAFRHSTAIAIDIFLLHGGDDWEDGITQIRSWPIPTFPIKGGDLIKRGLDAGPVVAKTLWQIEEQWIGEGFPDATRAAEIADQRVTAMLSERKS